VEDRIPWKPVESKRKPRGPRAAASYVTEFGADLISRHCRAKNVRLAGFCFPLALTSGDLSLKAFRLPHPSIEIGKMVGKSLFD
jgi:hypothetical protein